MPGSGTGSHCLLTRRPPAGSTLNSMSATPADVRSKLSGLRDPEIGRLLERGHEVIEDASGVYFGGGQVVMRVGEVYAAGSDWRRDGGAVGL